MKSNVARSLICCLLFVTGKPFRAISQITDSSQKLPTAGASVIWGKIDGVTIEGKVEGPSTEETELQIACVFEYTEDDIFKSPPALPARVNGMLHLDQYLDGLITDLRKNGQFQGHAYETILITPPKGIIKANRLILIGLGDRNLFTPDQMKGIGTVAMREALRLGVRDYAFASDLKDAGIESSTAVVAEKVVMGSFDAFRTERYLKSRNMTVNNSLHKITLLAGPSFLITAGDGIKKAIDLLNHK